MDYLAVVLASLSAIWLFHRFELVALGKAVLGATKSANAIAANSELSDLEKEQQTQQAAKQLLSHFFNLFFKTLVALGLPLVPVYALAYFDIFDIANIMTLMSSIEFILVFCLVFVVTLVKGKRV